MYHWVSDKSFLKDAYFCCSDLVNQLVQNLKNYDIYAAMNVVGSKSRNMITQNENKKIDFDFNLLIENASPRTNAEKLKTTIQTAFNDVLRKNDLHDCEDSTSALTTKSMHFPKGNRTEFSIDVCIVVSDSFGNLYRLIHSKTGIVNLDQWYWNQVPNSYELHKKEAYIKQNPSNWLIVREKYLHKKNLYLTRNDHNHPSFICYVESINEVYNELQNKWL